jgi:TetR/AcrR family transcriptional regulator, transcriptional repressor of bet genes
MNSPRQAFTREQPDQRRHSLIDACARCLAKHGIGGTTVRAICAEAGVSPGLLRHYFDGVNSLIAETYRATGLRVAEALNEAVHGAGDDSRRRLLAYLTASFRPPIADPQLLATWLAFWGLARTDRHISELHAQIYRDYRHDLETLIQGWQPGDHRLTAVALTALVDGLWLELSLGNAPFTPDEAALLAERYLDTLIN